jgi:hypothetical protein
MESKKFDEFVSDIFFDADVDDKVMVAASGEGKFFFETRAGICSVVEQNSNMCESE